VINDKSKYGRGIVEVRVEDKEKKIEFDSEAFPITYNIFFAITANNFVPYLGKFSSFTPSVGGNLYKH